jgi:hypothetical protein
VVPKIVSLRFGYGFLFAERRPKMTLYRVPKTGGQVVASELSCGVTSCLQPLIIYARAHEGANELRHEKLNHR